MKRNRETSSFLQIQLEKAQKIQFLSSIQKSFDLSNQASNRYDRYQSYVFYNSYEELKNFIAAGKPLGCIHVQNEEIDGTYFMVKTRVTLDLVPLIWDDARTYENYGLKYIPIKIQDHASFISIDVKGLNKMMHTCMLCLPRFEGTLCAYCKLSEVWKIHYGSNIEDYPRISTNLKAWVEKELN